ncbi:glycoside hydrolase family 30 protein [Gorillibacterium sp. sgz5001074]|uniref:glycoside hydrolase family 30 protein n=1 Tax=Gorillibacterium sp. sgz5001074 TaxID=3446695 RepID=UPI003F676A05
MTQRKIRVYQTARDNGDRLTEKAPVAFVSDPSSWEQESSLINVYEDVEYQEIEGFGGAFTEAAAVTLAKMSRDRQQEILKAYFDPEEGIGYTFCRTHINSCDFSLGNYAYVEEEDPTLSGFDITRDKKALIPMIRQASEIAGGRMKLFASPWSPPAWMKTNGEMNHGGSLKPEYRQTWAEYYVKYIQAYAQEGVGIWGLTVQNEAKAVQRWDSCVYTAEEEKDFVREHLGPALEKAGMSDVKVMIWDHNKERVYDRAKVAFDDKDASKYIWGIGFHWYSGDHFEALSAVQAKYPDKKLIFTEGCQEGGVQLGSWKTGERYGHDIMGNLNHSMSGWTDWNLVLDEKGGPNHVGNYCDAPIIADTVTGQVIYESSYYYIGHFSKFIRPGAKRVASTKYTDRLEVTAFKNTDGSVAVVVLNRTDEAIRFALRSQEALADSVIPAHAIQTYVYPSV